MDKYGLILEGGGMRGIYTAGVLDFFIENINSIFNSICYIYFKINRNTRK